MTDSPKNRSIWMLNDGRLGHWRQCQALLNGLRRASEELAAMPVHTLNVRPVAIQRWLAPRITPWADRGLNEPEAGNEPAVIIGAGRQSAGISRLLKQRYPDVFSIQILDPRMARDHFSVLIVPEHDGYQAGNVITMRGSLVDISRSTEMNDEPFWPDGEGHKLALLLAGDWNQNRGLLQLARKQTESGLVRTIISFAPRTRPKQQTVIEVEWMGLSYRILNVGHDRKSYARLLSTAEQFWVAGDSVNQLSEVLTVRNDRPVWIEPGTSSRRTQAWLKDLLARDEVRALDQYPETSVPQAVADSQRFWEQQPDRVASEVLVRFTQNVAARQTRSADR